MFEDLIVKKKKDDMPTGSVGPVGHNGPKGHVGIPQGIVNYGSSLKPHIDAQYSVALIPDAITGNIRTEIRIIVERTINVVQNRQVQRFLDDVGIV